MPSAPPNLRSARFAGPIRTFATLQVTYLAPVITNECLKIGAMRINFNFGAMNIRSYETLPSAAPPQLIALIPDTARVCYSQTTQNEIHFFTAFRKFPSKIIEVIIFKATKMFSNHKLSNHEWFYKFLSSYLVDFPCTISVYVKIFGHIFFHCKDCFDFPQVFSYLVKIRA